MTNDGGEPRDGASDEERADGVITTIAAVIRSGASALVDLIDRIVHGIRLVGPMVLGLGCQSTNDVANVAPPAVEVAPAPKEPPSKQDTGPRPLGKFTITFYYVVGEDESAAERSPVGLFLTIATDQTLVRNALHLWHQVGHHELNE